MDVKGFALQSSRVRKFCPKEESAILSFCVLNKIPYKLCKHSADRPEDFIPCGTVKWCENFLPPDRTIPNYYPDFLKSCLHRNVWYQNKWPLNENIFIKPADQHKRFNGLIITAGNKKKKRGPFWCSDIIKFTNEWRYYIADGRVLTGEWYYGDEINTPNAPEFTELGSLIPNGYCGAIDFGTLTTGELALVESNLPYACGWYGKKNELYVEWIIKGWKYVTNLTTAYH